MSPSDKAMGMLPVDDIRYMSEALRLARRGLYTTQPNPRVGCVIVKDGVIVGEGFHARAGGPHAEAVALKQAGYRAYGATAYVTLEPCAHHGRTPPCANELVIAGLKRVVAATEDANPLVAGKGMKILQDAGIETRMGVLAEEARALNAGFLRRIAHGEGGGLPLVRVKMASSLDGRTAMANGESKWITGTDARRDVQKWRAMSSAIISGIGTVLADDPELTVRPGDWSEWHYGEVTAPWRVILDADFRTPVKAALFKSPGRIIIVGLRSQLDRQTALSDAGAEIWVLPAGKDGRIDLKVLLQKLAAEGANEVLVEAGAKVAGSFARAGLVDEFIIYMAPLLLGSEARPLLDWPLASIRDQRKLVITDTRMVGSDIRLIAKPK